MLFNACQARAMGPHFPVHKFKKGEAMFKNLGMSEILIILLVLVLLFGAKKIPDLARSLGRSLNEFKKGREEAATDKPKDDEDEKKA
jgi:sec-independent protein translocase protein TatA